MINKISGKLIRDLLPKRAKNATKFTNGYVSVVGGSIDFPGAVRLASHAAARIGAGGVIALIPESIRHTTAAFPPEIIVWELKEYQGHLTHASAFEKVDKAHDNSKAILLSKVKIKNLKNNLEFDYQLVSHAEADVKAKKISVDSPIGKGLLGAKVGEKVKINVPTGEMEFEILAIYFD